MSNPENQTKINKTKLNQILTKFIYVFKQKSTQIIQNRTFNKIIAFFCLCPLLWLLVYLVVGQSALPGKGIYFSLLAMIVGAHLVGFIFETIKMPALLGMLIVGIGFRNIPYLNIVGKAIDPYTSSILRFTQISNYLF